MNFISLYLFLIINFSYEEACHSVCKKTEKSHTTLRAKSATFIF